MTILSTFLQDLTYAARQLRKTPGFTITVLLTLALGIGANAAIFTLINAVLLQNLPVTDPATIIRLGDKNDCCVGSGTRDNGDYSFFSTPTYETIRKNTPEIEDLAAIQAGFHYRPVIARRDGVQSQARSVMGEFVSGNYFRVFGLTPVAGRLFTDADNAAGAPMTAILSYESWQREYAADPSIVGSTFWINTRPVTLVGIAPKGFFGDRLTDTPPEFYLPYETMTVLANVNYIHDPTTSWLYMVGRIKPGTSIPALQDKVSALFRQSVASTRNFSGKKGEAALAKAHITIIPGGNGIQALQSQYKSQLHLLQWVSGLVLLIACANIANLLLVRGMARKSEISVRTALGATRLRIIRQLLTESVLLSLLGGFAALAVSYAGSRMLLHLAFQADQNVPIAASPSLVVIGFALSLALVAGILFGIAPAWITSNAQPADALRSGTRTTSGGASLLQRVLVVLQASLSLILLVGAGLFAQSLYKERNIDLHVDPTNRYIVHINPAAAGYKQTQVEALYRTMEDRFHAIPGVVKVGISTYTPLEDNNWGTGVQVLGKPISDNKGASFVKATAEYFDSVGTRVVMGRGIGVQDTASAPAVAVVNQAFVKDNFNPGENPIGQHFGQGGAASAGDFLIVGVVEDTAYQSALWKDHTMYFLPMTQRAPSDPNPIETDASLYAGAIVLQTERPISDMETIARRTLGSINPNLTVVDFRTLSDQIEGSFSQERMIARLTTLFGALALLLAAVGLYGVTAYTVVRRTSEIGIRMALGAARGSVVGMIMRGAVAQTGIGLAIGIPIAMLCVRFVKTQLYEITSADTTVMAIAVGTLALAAAVAGLIPARRAASIDPAKALRTE